MLGRVRTRPPGHSTAPRRVGRCDLNAAAVFFRPRAPRIAARAALPALVAALFVLPAVAPPPADAAPSSPAQQRRAKKKRKAPGRAAAPAKPRFTFQDLGDGVDAEVTLNDHGDVLIGVRREGLDGTVQKLETFLVPAGGKRERLPGDFTGLALNDAGQVVGYAMLGKGYEGRPSEHAVLWTRGGGLTDLTPASSGARATAINAAGKVAIADGPWSLADVARKEWPGAPLPSGPYGDGSFRPVALNDAGQVAGTQGLFSYLWSDGKMTDIAGLPGQDFTAVTGLNNKGDVCGYTVSGGPGYINAFLRRTGARDSVELSTSNRLGGTYNDEGAALSLNDAGDVVGTVLRSRGRFPVGAATWRVCSLAPAPSGETQERRAVLWRGGRVYDLTDLLGRRGWTLTEANAINKRGQIAGLARRDKETRVFLLTPAAAAAGARR